MVSFIKSALQGLFPGTQGPDMYIATASGISRSLIDAEAGADTVFGLNTADNGAGISNSLIDTDQDADMITGIGTGANSFGIAGGGIRAGSGNDTLVARGTLRGLENAAIDMGSGNDLADVQSGIGIITGGEGFDTLKLEGLQGEFNFKVLDPDVGTLDITRFNSDGTVDTDLQVTLFELFQFETADGSTFSEVTIQEIIAGA